MIFPNRWDCPVEVNVSILGIVWEHVSLEFGEPPEQVQPTYTRQSEEHPSPLLLFPSSHGSVNLLPSPQFYIHNDEAKLIVKPGWHCVHE